MKKYLLVIGLFCIIIGYTAMQVAIDTLLEVDAYWKDLVGGRLDENEDRLSEQQLIEIFNRYEATLQVSRAILVFGVVVIIYSRLSILLFYYD